MSGFDDGHACLLTAKGVECVVGGRRIVGPIDLTVTPGEIVALVGPNGAGKSTLLGALAGDRSCTGTVSIGSEPISALSPTQLARRRAVLPQDSSVSFPFRVREVVSMGRSPWRRTPNSDFDDEVVAAAMRDCDVLHLCDRTVPLLSGGERARVALARVLAQQTPLLLLDEPTAALDIHHQERTFELLRDRAGSGVGVVVVVHDLGLAAAHADRVVVICDGVVAASGSPREALDAATLSHVYRHEVAVLEHPGSPSPLIVPVRSVLSSQMGLADTAVQPVAAPSSDQGEKVR